MGFFRKQESEDVKLLKDSFKAKERAKIDAERAEAKLAAIRADARREAVRESRGFFGNAKADLITAGKKAGVVFGQAREVGVKTRKVFSKFGSGFGSNIKASSRKGNGLQSMLRR